MIIPSDILSWLQDYFASCCNGDWEHGKGITIETLDNPGWSVEISLQGTVLESVAFTRIEVETTEEDWYHCWRDGQGFHGTGGIRNLVDILETFRRWVEYHASTGA
jgi:hypothetical protein